MHQNPYKQLLLPTPQTTNTPFFFSPTHLLHPRSSGGSAPSPCAYGVRGSSCATTAAGEPPPALAHPSVGTYIRAQHGAATLEATYISPTLTGWPLRPSHRPPCHLVPAATPSRRLAATQRPSCSGCPAGSPQARLEHLLPVHSAAAPFVDRQRQLKGSAAHRPTCAHRGRARRQDLLGAQRQGDDPGQGDEWDGRPQIRRVRTHEEAAAEESTSQGPEVERHSHSERALHFFIPNLHLSETPEKHLCRLHDCHVSTGRQGRPPTIAQRARVDSVPPIVAPPPLLWIGSVVCDIAVAARLVAGRCPADVP